jgi:hypothetical protein
MNREKKVNKLISLMNEPMQIEGVSQYDKIDPNMELQHKLNSSRSISDDHLSTQICDESLENTPEAMEEPPEWEWHSCSKTILQEIQVIKSVEWNPSCLALNETSAKMNITMNKSFMWENNHKWNWHKSWNLPEILVSWQSNDRTPSSQDSGNLSVELYAVTINNRDEKKMSLEFVPMKGVCSKILSANKASFTSVQFASTSHVLKDARIHLIISVIQTDLESKNQKPSILNTLISPSIFVDSRKSTRDTKDVKREKLQSKYFDPFSPKYFLKLFTKKEGLQERTSIQDNLHGLLDYLTAHHIKSKIKHPVFLAEHFSSCVKLYYNNKKLRPIGKNGFNSMMFKLHDDLLRIKGQNYANNKESMENPCDISNKDFILLINNPEEDVNDFSLFKIISDHLLPLNHDQICITMRKDQIHSNFKLWLPTILQAAYSQCYAKIITVKTPTQSLEMEFIPLQDPVSLQASPKEILKTQEPARMVIESPLLTPTVSENHLTDFHFNQNRQPNSCSLALSDSSLQEKLKLIQGLLSVNLSRMPSENTPSNATHHIYTPIPIQLYNPQHQNRRVSLNSPEHICSPLIPNTSLCAFNNMTYSLVAPAYYRYPSF